jgi:hypothetical protein
MRALQISESHRIFISSVEICTQCGSEFAELKAVAVVERASFARAAQHLVSPSALSQTIRLLEAASGAVAEPHHPQRGTDGHWGAVVRAYRAVVPDT